MFLFILLCMLFCHIVDDFYLQGILAKMKQKSWWEEQTDNQMYQHDWLPALIAHGVSWSFMMMLPCNIYLLMNRPDMLYLFLIIFPVNVFVHCFIDHQKCNKRTICLCDDQCVHFGQIVFTFFYFFVLVNVGGYTQ